MSGSKAKREQRADFGGALLKLELKEQAHQDQSGQDEKKAKPQKKPPKILRFRARSQSLRADGLKNETKAGRIERAHEVRGECIGGPIEIGEANRGQIAKPAGPHLLCGGERDEGFRRAARVLPILFIFRANPGHLDRKASVPILGAFGFGQTRKIGHQLAISIGRLQCDDRADTKAVLLLFQSASCAENEIGELQLIARFRLQIVGKPLVDHDFIIAHLRRDKGSASAGDH